MCRCGVGGCIGGCAQAYTSQNVSMGVCVCRYINVNIYIVYEGGVVS